LQHLEFPSVPDRAERIGRFLSAVTALMRITSSSATTSPSPGPGGLAGGRGVLLPVPGSVAGTTSGQPTQVGGIRRRCRRRRVALAGPCGLAGRHILRLPVSSALDEFHFRLRRPCFSQHLHKGGIRRRCLPVTVGRVWELGRLLRSRHSGLTVWRHLANRLLLRMDLLTDSRRLVSG